MRPVRAGSQNRVASRQAQHEHRRRSASQHDSTGPGRKQPVPECDHVIVAGIGSRQDGRNHHGSLLTAKKPTTSQAAGAAICLIYAPPAHYMFHWVKENFENAQLARRARRALNARCRCVHCSRNCRSEELRCPVQPKLTRRYICITVTAPATRQRQDTSREKA